MAERQGALGGQKSGRSRKGIARPSNVTEEEKRVIRELYSAGYTGLQIEQITGIGHTTIYKIISRTRASNPTWTDDEIQILVDGYLEKKKISEIAEQLPGRSIQAIRIKMCRYRKEVRKDPKKRRALSAITLALKAVRKADQRDGGVMFGQPFYVSPHAVKRFRERVADLPTKTIRTIIMAALQDNRQQVAVQIYNRRPCPIYRAQYRDVEYLIPVIHEEKKKDSWPVVPTILLPHMDTNPIIYERSGWRWN
ncbi:MAG: hypothetical protein ACOY9Y_06670 [Bacillota bacterium]